MSRPALRRGRHHTKWTAHACFYPACRSPLQGVLEAADGWLNLIERRVVFGPRQYYRATYNAIANRCGGCPFHAFPLVCAPLTACWPRGRARERTSGRSDTLAFGLVRHLCVPTPR